MPVEKCVGARQPGKDYTTQQAKNIAVARVLSHWSWAWTQHHPGAKPVVTPGARQSVLTAVGIIGREQGKDYFAAEVELCGYAEVFARLGYDLTGIHQRLNDCRATVWPRPKVAEGVAAPPPVDLGLARRRTPGKARFFVCAGLVPERGDLEAAIQRAAPRGDLVAVTEEEMGELKKRGMVGG